MSDGSGLRLGKITVNNFKSLVNFELQLSTFTCLVGLNGTGKSTILQFIDFLSQLVRGSFANWLEERRWKPRDVRSTLAKKKNVEFKVAFLDQAGRSAGSWEAHFNPWINRCTWERLDMVDCVLEVTSESVKIDYKEDTSKSDWTSKITFSYDGSILSSLKEALLPASIREVKQFFVSIESLDMLTPERLRQRTRDANGSLGHGGRNLSAFLYEMGPKGLSDLTKTLVDAYPALKQLYVKSIRSGWKHLLAREQYGDTRIWTGAPHLNDGLLRLLAILAEIASAHSVILFDEIENGINPELIEFVIDLLAEAQQQIVVTTHSPIVLNYLTDRVAKKSVIYVYKIEDGSSKAIRMFSIPSLKKKLAAMGPGEVFADTHLTKLADEIRRMASEGE